MKNRRILIWLVVILGVTNLATIISALSYSSSVRRAESERQEAATDARVIFFRDYLDLDEGQMRQFVNLNRSFSLRAGRITSQLDRLRRQMIEELSHDKSDDDKVNSIASQIGTLHKELKQATAEYYSDLRGVCTPEQRILLREAFLVMSDPQGDFDAFRRERMHQRRPGMGRGERPFGMGRGGRFGDDMPDEESRQERENRGFMRR